MYTTSFLPFLCEQSTVVPRTMSEFAFDPNREVEDIPNLEDDLHSLPADLDPEDLRNISDDENDGKFGRGYSLCLQLQLFDGHTYLVDFHAVVCVGWGGGSINPFTYRTFYKNIVKNLHIVCK